MATRSKAPMRRERESDSMESLKPIVVLVLLGMILYGAYSVVQKGSEGASQAWQFPGTHSDQVPPPATQAISEAPPFAVQQLEIPPATPAASQFLAEAAPLTAAIVPVAPQVFAPPLSPPVAASAPAVARFSDPPDSLSPAVAAGSVSAALTPAIMPPLGATVEPPPTYLNAVSAAAPVANAIPAPTDLLPAHSSTFRVQPPAILEPQASSIALTPPLTVPPQSTAFVSAWADAHDKLTAGRYAEALAVLSAWHDDTSLGLEESQRLEELLGQLAGTVIYSQQDLLMPPHIVGPGETLPAIAAPLLVPWQLLAKINGVTDPARLIPGEPLKLVQGPFDAVVSVSLRRLSLQVGGNYAGSFPVVVGRQIQDRVGSSLEVVEVRRGVVPADKSGPLQQVAYLSQGQKLIGLAEGMAIESVDDPAAVNDSLPTTSLIVSARDLDEIIDILGSGSHVLIRQ